MRRRMLRRSLQTSLDPQLQHSDRVQIEDDRTHEASMEHRFGIYITIRRGSDSWTRSIVIRPLCVIAATQGGR